MRLHLRAESKEASSVLNGEETFISMADQANVAAAVARDSAQEFRATLSVPSWFR